MRAALALGVGVLVCTACRPARGEPREIAVGRGGDLQAALERARPGDTLVLEAGATYAGPFVLPRKTGDGWITIRGPRPVEAGRRAGPAGARDMPGLVAERDQVVLAAPGAHHFRLEGLEIRPAAGRFLRNLVVLGDTSTPDADVPHDLVVAGCYIHGDPSVGGRRGVALNSARTRIVDSYLADFKERGADTQAVGGWAGPGPFLIENNYLEAAGENILFGGADPPSPRRIPSDIEIRGNHLSKPLSWKPDEPGYDKGGWTVKNLLELKDARRVRIEGNLLEHSWPAGQNGFAILFTVRNQDGHAPWSTVEDVSFRGNVVRGVAAAINILGRDDRGASGQARRIDIRDNLFVDVGGPRWGGSGTLFQLLDGTADVVITHNTALQAGNVLTVEGAPHQGFVFEDNVVLHNKNGMLGTGAGTGKGALSAYCPGARVRRNVLAGGRAADYPPDNFFPARLEGVLREGELRGLVDGSPYRRAGTDGRDLGADPRAVGAALRAVSKSP